MADQEYAFLKLTPDVAGTATTKGHENQIVLESLAFGHVQTGKWAQEDTESARVVSFQDVSFSKEFDKASPTLLKSCAMKTKYDEAVITVKSGDVETLKMTLKKVLLTSAGVSYGAGQDNPTESYTMSFRWVQWEKGTEKGGFDLEANTQV